MAGQSRPMSQASKSISSWMLYKLLNYNYLNSIIQGR